jgi:hypothetical protein
MEYEFIDRHIDPLLSDYEAACDYPGCGWTTKVRMHSGVGLKVGDLVYRDPENEVFGRCVKCKRRSLRITKVPPQESPPDPKGFWKLPDV